jgi:predicted Zn-dependent protease
MESQDTNCARECAGEIWTASNRAPVWTALIAFCALSTSCGLSPSAADRFARAQQSISEGNVTAAIVDLKTVLQKEPRHVEARLLLGDVFLQQGEAAGAEKEFRQAVKLLRAELEAGEPQPNTARLVDATARLAVTQLLVGDLDEASETAAELLKLAPDNATGYIVSSQVAYYKGAPDEARSYAEALLARDPENGAASALLGFIAAGGGQYADAEQRLSAAVAARPDSAGFRVALAQMQRLQGKAVDAVRTLAPLLLAAPTDARLLQVLDLIDLRAERALEGVQHLAEELQAQSPESPLPSLLKGRAAYVAGRHQEAVGHFADAIRSGGGRYPVIGKYTSQRATNDHSGSYETLSGWLESHPEDGGARELLAAAYLEDGKHESAKTQYEALVANGGASPIALNNLAWLYGENGDPRGIELAREAHQQAPENASISDTLGWLLVSSGELKEGIRYLRLAVEQAPEQTEIREHLTLALARRTEEEVAEERDDSLVAARSQGTPIDDSR